MYVVPRQAGNWELRESHMTASGPRSRTLASFRSLTREAVARAQERATRPLPEREVAQAARRAGAPVALDGASEAAASLLAELDRGRRPASGLARLLVDAMGGAAEVSDAERAAGAWVGASPAKRGEALRDLLLLADRIPVTPTRPGAPFPRLESAPR